MKKWKKRMKETKSKSNEIKKTKKVHEIEKNNEIGCFWWNEKKVDDTKRKIWEQIKIFGPLYYTR
jgi:hypothetical protein